MEIFDDFTKAYMFFYHDRFVVEGVLRIKELTDEKIRVICDRDITFLGKNLKTEYINRNVIMICGEVESIIMGQRK